MPRIADVLESESRTVDLEQGDFERLLGRRERKQRNRRIRAGAVGVIVTLATGFILVRSATSDGIPADRSVEPRPVPAASGTLAYALDGDIYVADPDGSNAVKIADGRSTEDCYGWSGEYWAEGPMWSPDGRYLAFRRFTGCSSEENPRDVVISDAEGNVVATFPSMGWGIAWSQDSTRVAVWDTLHETIGVYGLDGVRQTQLTETIESGDHDPMWMPSGTSLVLTNVEFPLDGGTPRQLPLPAPAVGRSIAYSPDGSLVAYGTRRSLTVARSDGSEPREVFGDGAFDPTWSPTGDRIAFSTDEVRVLDMATGSVTPLTDVERASILQVIGFSPEGDRILFSKSDADGGGSSLWTVGVDGSDARLLVAETMHGEWLSR